MTLKLSHAELRQIVQALGDSRLRARLRKFVQPQRLCSNEDCAQPFFPKRSDQTFCSPHCSQIQRQREYWLRRGKQVRRQRVTAARANAAD